MRFLFDIAYKFNIPVPLCLPKRFKTYNALEIGGLSGIFKNFRAVPAYHLLKNLDIYNWNDDTVWQNNYKNLSFAKNKKANNIFIGETNLNGVKNNFYDLILASHVVEHLANPLKNIEKWLGLLKNTGEIIIIVPDKNKTFDHKRNYTEFSHLTDDYNKNIEEDDLTHLNEILALHDLSKDIQAGTPEQFKIRSLDNLNNRTLHHHVFSMKSLEETVQFFNLKIIKLIKIAPFHQILWAKK